MDARTAPAPGGVAIVLSDSLTRIAAPGLPPYLSAATLDSLATFETSREDLEDGGDTELVNEDGTDGSALEWQAEPGGFVARSAYLAGRQERHRATYDATRDDEELRKVKRQVNALVAKKRKRVKA